MRGLTNQIGDSREQMERGGNHRRDVFILEESCQVAHLESHDLRPREEKVRTATASEGCATRSYDTGRF